MSNGKYRSIHVNDVEEDWIRDRFMDRPMVFGVDVAKTGMYAGLGTPDGEVHRIITWSHPSETRRTFEAIQRWSGGSVEMVLEPTGTYDDPLRYQADQYGWDVYRVAPKRMHDASEVYDGVPSSHDAKACCLLVWLHGQSISTAWSLDSTARRGLKSWTQRMTRLDTRWDRAVGRLEATLGRHFPEVLEAWEFSSASLLGVLKEFGSPAAIRQQSTAVRQRMRAIGGHWLNETRIDGLIENARDTVGVPMTDAETRTVKALADRADEIRRNRQSTRRQLRSVVEKTPGVKDVECLAEEVGLPTAAEFRVSVGDFREFEAPRALINAFGLTLKERSSGTQQGQLHITKRGSGEARQLLYLATLRKIKDDPIFAAWHDKKVAREGGKRKKKSVIALCRKYLNGLWHVAKGSTFDPRKLFDVSKLEVA